jgi:hypothetical protein
MDENDYHSETAKLKRQLDRERLLHEAELAKAERKAFVEKDKHTERLAIVLVLLFCAVAIILGLTGVVD